jgi:Ca2+-binding EF-hand superfamily protein
MATDELAAKLQRRNEIIEWAEQQQLQDDAAKDATDTPAGLGASVSSSNDSCPRIWNPYTEFKEFTRKQIQQYQKTFNEYDIGRDKYIDFQELKRMMEKLGCPQTHLALKSMIRQVDEDRDNRISFREFLLIFRKAMAGELPEDSGLYDVYRLMSEIDVDKEGVKGAKNFFEAKIDELSQVSKYEREIRNEQEERRRLDEERRQRRIAFKATASLFQQSN